MKKSIINVVFVLLTIALIFSSCNSGKTTKESKEADIVFLIFEDYSDFIKFGTEGTLDSIKYEDTDFLMSRYSLVDGAFVDIRELLETPVLPQGWTDCVVIDSHNKYRYSLYSTDEAGRKKLELSVFVEYYSNTSDMPETRPMESITSVNNLNGIEGEYTIQHNGTTLGYDKNSNGFVSFSVRVDQLSIGFFFGESGMPIDQIQERCGDTIASLFSDNPDVFSAATASLVDTVNSRFNYETE